jgi:uncharacterized protein (DUF983 family)
LELTEGQIKGRACEECGGNIWSKEGYQKEGYQRVKCVNCENRNYPQTLRDNPFVTFLVVVGMFVTFFVLVSIIKK